MHISTDRPWSLRFMLLLLALAISSPTLAAVPRIKETKFESGDNLVVVKVASAGRKRLVTISDAESGQVLAEKYSNRKGKLEAKVRLESGEPVPCRIRVETAGGAAQKDLAEAPSDCGQVSTGGETGSEGEEEYSGGGESGGTGIAEHSDLRYQGPATCLACHEDVGHDVLGSTHYLWNGDTPYMLNAQGIPQGKNAGAVNAYCGNILGNWDGCSTCHIGLGAKPQPAATTEQLANIDCLICHQEAYKRKREGDVMVPDVANMSISMDEAVRTVHKPTRATCLQCHAKAGGGDAVKRGDLALATAHTTDEDYDVHMATTGANLSCQDCHRPQGHRFPGKGSDIRPTDLDQPLECASSGCHEASPHESRGLNRHLDRVACQTCHVPVYGKDASDSVASEATEIYRSWKSGTESLERPYHPVTTKANNLIPVYRHWNRYSDNYLLFDEIHANPDTGTYQTSVPDGAVGDPESKLYPFKYKQSDYPLRTASNELIALDTSEFFTSANAHDATVAGLVNMGYSATDNYEWVITDTYQLLNHQVSKDENALRCADCHMNTSRMDLQRDLGYAPSSDSKATCATGCHSGEKADEWTFGVLEEHMAGHKKHREKGVACRECHGFDR